MTADVVISIKSESPKSINTDKPIDIELNIKYGWLVRKIGEQKAAALVVELASSLRSYLDKQCKWELDYIIYGHIPEEPVYHCSHHNRRGFYAISICNDLDEIDSARLECDIDLSVIRPLLQDYCLTD